MATEKRLIDANALKKRMFNYYGCVNEHTCKSNYTGETLMDYEVAGLIDDCIDDAQTVDAVEVVRCRDCKHQIERGYAQYRYKWCEVWRRINGMGDDGFCNYGERKDDV